MQIKKTGVLYHPMVPATRAKAAEICQFLNSQGIETWTSSAWETEHAREMLDGTDLILTAGGDGTILRAAQIVLSSNIPITGINMGTLGFLTEIKADEVMTILPDLLSGKGWLDERAMLEAELTPADSSTVRHFTALNDVVLARGAIARLVQVKTIIDGQLLTSYRADGVIVASATGSTGYSLAAGGPILYPECEDILLVPIVPHLGLDHSLVLPPSSQIELQLVSNLQSTLSIDGHINLPVDGGTRIKVSLSSHKIHFLRLRPRGNFYTFLEEKLQRKNR
ncbi:MAG: NAD(+)/NADH kinase [Dehalococcoidales bacterium]|nr:NAD(+)/NADH kinase [Dehalococcoidales bacterium]